MLSEGALALLNVAPDLLFTLIEVLISFMMLARSYRLTIFSSLVQWEAIALATLKDLTFERADVNSSLAASGFF